MAQFELDFVDLNLGYSFLYLTASTNNSLPFDDGDKSLISNLILTHICLCLVLRRNNSPKSCAVQVCFSNNVFIFCNLFFLRS